MRLGEYTLTVRYSRETRRIVWELASENRTLVHRKHKKLDELKVFLRDCRSAWKAVLQAVSMGREQEARERLEGLQKKVTAELLPPTLELPARGSPIWVIPQPEDLPIELILIHGEPLPARHAVICGRLSGANGEAELAPEHAGRSAMPTARLTIMCDVLMAPDDARPIHREMIRHSLSLLYGERGVHDQTGEVARPDADTLLNAMCSPDVSCHYHLGHGQTGMRGGSTLVAANGPVSSEDIELRPRVFGGFAFLNACHSGAAGESGASDPALALLKLGRSAVLSTVLPPLDSQAAEYAGEFFAGLPEHGLDLARTYHHLTEQSWKEYQAKKCAKVPLCWACYRLYGSPMRRFLRTAITTEYGDVVVPWDHRTIKIGSVSGPEDCNAVRQFLQMGNDPELRDKPGSFLAEVARQDNPAFAPFGKAAVQALLTYPNFRSDVFDPGAEEIIAPRVSDPAVDVKKIVSNLKRTSWRFSVAPAEHAVAIAYSDDALRSIQQLLRAYPKRISQAELQWFYRNDRPLYAPAIDPAKLPKSVQRVLETAWWFARARTPRVEAVQMADLCQTVVAFAATDGVWAHVAPGQRLPDRALKGPLPKDEQIGPDALRYICGALDDWTTDEMKYPYWWHLVEHLCMWPDLTRRGIALRRLGLDPVSLWQRIVLDHSEDTAHRVLPLAARVGKPVGVGLSVRLPKVAAVRWADALADAARRLADEKSVALVVPWRRSDFMCQCPAGTAQPLDAVCMHVRFLADGSFARGRLWFHVPASALVARLAFEAGHFDPAAVGWFGKHRVVSRLQTELQNKGIACVSGIENWLENGRVPSDVLKLLQRIARGQPPSLMFLPATDYHSTNALCQELKRLGMTPIVLEPLQGDNAAFLHEWEELRTGKAINGEHQLAVDRLVEFATEMPEIGLGNAMEVLGLACTGPAWMAAPRPLTREDIQRAIVKFRKTTIEREGGVVR
jgi:hypothetical protein